MVAMKAQLIIVEGKQKGRVIDLNEPLFVVGRGERCHLRPTSELVSREHAEFAIEGGDLVVRDMGSRNGTLLNGKALTSTQILHDGDKVQVGPLIFAVAMEQGKAKGRGKKPDAPPSTDDGEAHEETTGSKTHEVQGGSTIMIPAFKSPPIPDEPKGKAKGKAKAPIAPSKAAAKSANPAGKEILQKMMDRRRKPKT
jgi:predicted component of type VI protein secretion system